MNGELADLLRGLDPSWCDERSEAELMRYETEVSRVSSRLAAAVANARASRARRRSSGCGHDAADDDDSAHRTGRTRRETAQDRRRGQRISFLPRFAAAWAAGDVTPDHVDVLVAVPDRHRDGLIEDEDELLQMARANRADRFRDLVRRWQTRRDRRAGDDTAGATRRQRRLTLGRRRHHDGLDTLFAELDTESYATIRGAIADEARRLGAADADPSSPDHDPDRTHEQRMVDALVNICAGFRRGAEQGPARPLFLVLVDLATLRGHLTLDGRCEIPGIGPIDPAEARRILERGDASFKTLVLDGHGAPLYLSTDHRFASVEQRQALAVVHPTCVGPDCDVPVSECHVHHVDPAAIGGPTDIDKLVPLCTADHHKVHDAGHRVTKDPLTHRVTWHPPPPDPSDAAAAGASCRRRSAGGVNWEEPALL